MKFFIAVGILVTVINIIEAQHQQNYQPQAQPQQAQPQRYQEPQLNYQPFAQAPANIKQLLQLQQAREPVVHLPPQPVPNLGPAQPIKPVQIAQGQLPAQGQHQYQPQVQYGANPQQPNYENQAAAFNAQYQQRQQPQAAPGPQYQQPNPQYQG
ncbi:DNA translocase FtsK-like [Microplitis mediator]|uniref:DNA translocase FtsK-like n=1 Tax=Microplitis mediator TaxID=375433 RepID=UPI002552A2F8|nr:DNA translocase FtsK-like [Microplitis mediator]